MDLASTRPKTVPASSGKPPNDSQIDKTATGPSAPTWEFGWHEDKCPHLHFKYDVVKRDILTKKQHLNLLSTPKGYRWEVMKKGTQPKEEEEEEEKEKDADKSMIFSGPKCGYIHNFLKDIWNVLSEDMVKRLVQMLMTEFGLTEEEAISFICEQRLRSLAMADPLDKDEFTNERTNEEGVQNIEYFGDAVIDHSNPRHQKQKAAIDPNVPRVIINPKSCETGEFAIGVDPCHVREFAQIISHKLAQYAMDMMCVRRNHRHRRMAEVILNELCQITGERCALDKPKNKVHRILTFTADKLALWLNNIIPDQDKIQKSFKRKEERNRQKMSKKKRDDEEKRRKDKDDYEKNREKQDRIRKKKEREDQSSSEKPKSPKDKGRGEGKQKTGKGEGKPKSHDKTKMSDAEPKSRGDGEKRGDSGKPPSKSRNQGAKSKDTSSGKPKDASSGKPKDASSGKPKDASSGKTKDASSGKPKDASSGKPRDASSVKPKDASSGKPKDTSSGKPKDNSSAKKTDAPSKDTRKPDQQAGDKSKAPATQKPKSMTSENQNREDASQDEAATDLEESKSEFDNTAGKPEESQPNPDDSQRNPEDMGQPDVNNTQSKPEGAPNELKEDAVLTEQSERKPSDGGKKENESDYQTPKESPSREKGDEGLQKDETMADRKGGDIGAKAPYGESRPPSEYKKVEDKPVAGSRQDVLKSVISDQLKEKVPDDDNEIKAAVKDVSKETAAWMDKKIESVEDALKDKKKRPVFNVKKLEDWYEIEQTFGNNETAKKIRESRKGSADSGHSKSAKAAQNWAKWAVSASDVSQEWAGWIDKTVQEAESKARDYKSEGKKLGHLISVDQEDWNQFQDKTQKEALEWRRNKKAMDEVAQLWPQKIPGA